MMLNLDKNKKYLLACSFGPDSMALFHMLQMEGYDFEAALVNYNLREESTQEMLDFIDYCEKQGVKHHELVIDKWEKQNNLEARCRNIRYRYFADLVEKYGFFEVLVAHNEDDAIETFLLQNKRKNLLFSYGLRQNSELFGVKINRPLIGFSKAALKKFCLTYKIPHSIDKTNLQDTFERNKIRHQIVEKLSQEEREEILKQIEYRNFVIRTKLDYLNSLDLSDCEQLLTLDEEEFVYAVNILTKKIDEAMSVSKRQCEEIYQVLESKKSNVSIKLKNHIIFEKSYGSVYLYKDLLNSYSYRIEGPIELDTEYFYLNFTKDSANRNVSKDDYPLTIRNAQKDDVYLIKDYQVKVNRLFIDWKMPPHLRKRWPVILNKDNKIIYIPRYQRNFRLDKKCNFYVK